MRKNLRLLCCGVVWASLLVATPVLAAPYVWITTDGTAAQAHVGELIPLPKAPPAPALSEPRAVLADGKALPVRQAGDGYAITLPAGTPPGDVRFTAKSLASDGVPTIFEAKAGRAQTRPVNDLELVPTEPGGTTFRLYWKGRPVVVSQVNVQTSAGWQRTLYAAADGSVSLVSARFPDLFASLYVLSVTVKVNGKVTLNGKTYDQVRHTATLAFGVP